MLKLGTETGSLTNHLRSRMVNGQPEPVVGMGATLLHWTDRTACTVVGWDGKILTVQGDNAKRVDSNGMSECQDYEYTPNPNGGLSYFKKTKSGFWVGVRKNPETGRWVQSRGAGLTLGVRMQYHDFSF